MFHNFYPRFFHRRNSIHTVFAAFHLLFKCSLLSLFALRLLILRPLFLSRVRADFAYGIHLTIESYPNAHPHTERIALFSFVKQSFIFK